MIVSVKKPGFPGFLISGLSPTATVYHPFLAQNRNVFLVRRGRGLGIANEINDNLEAASGFEPLHRGFADLSLNHLGTPPSKK